MALESVTNIDDLNAANPVVGDPVSEGDDHIRNIKTALTTDFPNISGVMSATHTELNALYGVTAGTVTASKGLVVDSSSKLNTLNVDNLDLDGNTISTTNTNGDLVIAPDGTGDVDFDACSIMLDTTQGIKDAGGDEYIIFTESSTPVNYIGVHSADSASGPAIAAEGSDTNISLNLIPKGTGKVDVQGAFMTSETATLSGAGAIPITGSIAEWTTTSTDAGTLADGVEGQHLFVILKVDGGTGTLTPTNGGGYTNIAFADAGDSVHLLFTNGNWYIVGQGGLTTGPLSA